VLITEPSQNERGKGGENRRTRRNLWTKRKTNYLAEKKPSLLNFNIHKGWEGGRKRGTKDDVAVSIKVRRRRREGAEKVTEWK